MRTSRPGSRNHRPALALLACGAIAVGAAACGGKSSGDTTPAGATGYWSAPATEWWQSDSPCPNGSTLKEESRDDFILRVCARDGVRHGPAATWDPRGLIRENGLFREDRRTGTWVTYKGDGTVKEKQLYDDGVLLRVDEHAVPQAIPLTRGGEVRRDQCRELEEAVEREVCELLFHDYALCNEAYGPDSCRRKVTRQYEDTVSASGDAA